MSRPDPSNADSNLVPARMRDASAAGTVARVVQLLACLAESDGAVSIKSLCQTLKLPASTVHRLLGLLGDEGMVERRADRPVYAPGLELVRIASLLASKVRIVDVARPFMRTIVQECDETCCLLQYVPERRKVMALHAEFSSHPLRYRIEFFQPHSLLWGATGRAVLAFLPPDAIEAALRDNDASPATGAALPARNALLADLSEIRTRGYAITHGQKIKGAVGIGAPLFNSERRVVGSLCITIPETRFNRKAQARLSQMLMSRAAELSRALGYEPLPQAAE
ncbi:MAG: IclR family transcriptional regulator [Pseudorhodoplanes sp.]|uniref:IclR family transcriptional regulator n=1 Tax=Pseudorhodoplanes sp. TaxID=1934341 RepID=UPI003D0E20EC